MRVMSRDILRSLRTKISDQWGKSIPRKKFFLALNIQKWLLQRVGEGGEELRCKCPCPQVNVPSTSQNALLFPELSFHFLEVPFFFLGIALLFSRNVRLFFQKWLFVSQKCLIVFQNWPLVLQKFYISFFSFYLLYASFSKVFFQLIVLSPEPAQSCLET